MILRNAIETPDGTVLTSRNIHDFKEYKDQNGETYMVDGGSAYCRRNVCEERHKELVITTEDSHDVIREGFEWGTYGIDGDQPLKYVLLKDMTDDNIIAITNYSYSRDLLKVFIDELEWRKNNA